MCSDQNTSTRPHLANDEDVGEPGGEAVACAILDVHHVKRARVTLPVGDHTDTPQVSTAGHHAQVTWEGAEGGKSCHFKYHTHHFWLFILKELQFDQ